MRFEDDIVYEQEFQPGTLSQWIEHIEDKRGWQTLNYADGTALAGDIEQLGEDESELAIFAAVHGSEPCGVHAIETPDVQKSVKCIIANERALRQGVRYIEQDLNCVFLANQKQKRTNPG